MTTKQILNLINFSKNKIIELEKLSFNYLEKQKQIKLDIQKENQIIKTLLNKNNKLF